MAFEFDAYEFRADIIPGGLFLLGLFILFPGVQGYLAAKEVTFAGLGLLLILAFVIGTTLRALGGGLAAVYWSFWRGMPSAWIPKGTRLVGEPTRAALLAKLVATSILPEGATWKTIDEGEGWNGVPGRMAAHLRKAGSLGRLDVFNATYGMYRGLAMVFLVLFLVVGVFATAPPSLFAVPVTFAASANLVLPLLFAAALLCGLGMHRSSVSYAQELVSQFLACA